MKDIIRHAGSAAAASAMMRRAEWAVLLAVVISGQALTPLTWAHAATSYLPVIEAAPAFSLVGTDGKAVKSSDLAGKVTLLTFMYTHCTTVCPMVTERMRAVADRLKREGLFGEKARLVSISFDPQRDTPGWLKTYARSFRDDPESWMFLTGTSGELASLLKRYNFYARRGPTGDFDHVSRVYLIDRNGRVRQIYALGFLDPEVVLRDARSLLDESDAARGLAQRGAGGQDNAGTGAARESEGTAVPQP